MSLVARNYRLARPTRNLQPSHPLILNPAAYKYPIIHQRLPQRKYSVSSTTNNRRILRSPKYISTTYVDSDVRLYNKLRSGRISRQAIDCIIKLLYRTTRGHRLSLLERVAKDLLSHLRSKLQPRAFNSIAMTVLLLSNRHRVISHDSVLGIYQALKLANARKRGLPSTTLARVTKAMIASPPQDPFTEEHIVTLSLRLIDRGASLLLQHPAPEQSIVCKYVGLAFRVLERQISSNVEGSRERAMPLFRRLVEVKGVPQEALVDTGALRKWAEELPERGNRIFQVIIISTIIRSCLVRDWSVWAEEYLARMFEICTSEQREDDYRAAVNMATLIIEHLLAKALESTDDEQVKEHLGRASGVIQRFFMDQQTPGNVDLPIITLRRFYNTCRTLKHFEPMAHVYRNLESRFPGKFPLPADDILIEFTNYLIGSRNITLAKGIADRIWNENIHIQMHYMAAWILCLCRMGHMNRAFQTWRICVRRPHNEMITGNGKLVSTLVSKHMDMVERDMKIGDNPSTPLMIGFARQVTFAFANAKAPLKEAAHFDLTTLARAFIAIGEYQRAFDALGHLTARKEIPDIYDLNLLIGALAKHNARKAATLLRRMIPRKDDITSEGTLKPNLLSFELVLRGAFQQGDAALVEEVVQAMGEMGYNELSNEALVSLLSQKVATNQGGNRDARTRTLDSTLAMMKSRPKSAVPRVGSVCIDTALDLGRYKTAIEIMSLCYSKDPAIAGIAGRITNRLLDEKDRNGLSTRVVNEVLTQLNFVLNECLIARGPRLPTECHSFLQKTSKDLLQVTS